MDLITELTILVLAAFVGFEVISKVPAPDSPPAPSPVAVISVTMLTMFWA